MTAGERNSVEISAHYPEVSSGDGAPKPPGYSLVSFFTDTISDFHIATDLMKGTVTINGELCHVTKCGPVTRSAIVPNAAHFGQYCYTRPAFRNGVGSKLPFGAFIYFAEASSPTDESEPMAELRMVLGNQVMGVVQLRRQVKIPGNVAIEILGKPPKRSSNPSSQRQSLWMPTQENFVYHQGGYEYFTYLHRDQIPGTESGFLYYHPATQAAYLWEFAPNCIEIGETLYDKYIAGLPFQAPKQIDDKTLLLVIDMQNDFVTGSFKMPCNHKMIDLTDRIADLIDEVSANGGIVIASMDYHSQDHCGTDGTCINKVFLSQSDEEISRYSNQFPPHTQFEKIEGERGTPTYPSEGAKLHSKVFAAMAKAKLRASSRGAPRDVDIVFKGFNETIESFSAFPHFKDGEAADHEAYTGAFTFKRGMPTYCFTEKLFSPSCYPTLGQIEEPAQKMESLATIIDKILKNQQRPISQILVTGLVFDFCVKETAIFTKKFVTHFFPNGPPVMVPMQLARPAFEGLPGIAGPLGGTEHIKATAEMMQSHGVELVQLRYTPQEEGTSKEAGEAEANDGAEDVAKKAEVEATEAGRHEKPVEEAIEGETAARKVEDDARAGDAKEVAMEASEKSKREGEKNNSETKNFGVGLITCVAIANLLQGRSHL